MIGKCKSCGVTTVWNVDDGVDEHPEGSMCIEAVPAATRQRRLEALLALVGERGERYVVTMGWRRGEDTKSLVAVRNGRVYALDYTCRGIVKAGHSYVGVQVETGIGGVPVAVAEEEGREAFFVALDPRSAVPVSEGDVLAERHAEAFRNSPLVFEVRRDRRDADMLVVVLLEGSVSRVHKNGTVKMSRGPFAVEEVQKPFVREGLRAVGVPGNARFTHVALDLQHPERVQSLLALPRGELAARVAVWDEARVEVVDRASARLTAHAAEV